MCARQAHVRLLGGSCRLASGRHHVRRRRVPVGQRRNLQPHLRVLHTHYETDNILDIPALDFCVIDGHELVAALYLS